MYAGRIPPEQWYPAGDPVARARFLPLPSGWRVRVVEAGPTEGVPVVLVHGWACSAYSFRHTIPALAAAGRRVVAVDLLGHGLSDKPLAASLYSAHGLTSYLVAVLDALEVPRADLVGHSLGGGLALRLALHHPERVRRLAALSPVGFGGVPVLRMARACSPAVVERMLPRVMPRWMFRIVLELAHGVRGGYAARDVDEYWAPTQFPAFARVLRRVVHEFDWEPLTREALRELGVPFLLVVGGRDLLVPMSRELLETLREGFGARAELLQVPWVGHVVQEEAPAEVNAVLTRFLGRSRPVATSPASR
ncbi:MAG TPA: alpha/beta fold hydrolase [Gemmatimonadaceae bacterium]|nr:alpha/beta fold hydrolase [Gemmatimonadaceae bacterium]